MSLIVKITSQPLKKTNLTALAGSSSLSRSLPEKKCIWPGTWRITLVIIITKSVKTSFKECTFGVWCYLLSKTSQKMWSMTKRFYGRSCQSQICLKIKVVCPGWCPSLFSPSFCSTCQDVSSGCLKQPGRILFPLSLGVATSARSAVFLTLFKRGGIKPMFKKYVANFVWFERPFGNIKLT